MYEQLPLDGMINDYNYSIQRLKYFKELREALVTFYKENKQFNPRQLHYIIETESVDLHLDELIK